jgi:HSP20 family protein
MRQLALGDGIDADKITATYENGVLTVTLPVAERAKPRRVSVAVQDKGETIEARQQAEISG